MIHKCNTCKKDLSVALFCGRCKSVTYCNASCQRTDWPAHKKNCLKSNPNAPVDERKLNDAVTPLHRGSIGISAGVIPPQSAGPQREVELSWSIGKFVVCAHCQKAHKVGEMKKCGGCFTKSYCSEACQRSDWKLHKPVCERSKTSRRGVFTASKEALLVGAKRFAANYHSQLSEAAVRGVRGHFGRTGRPQGETMSDFHTRFGRFSRNFAWRVRIRLREGAVLGSNGQYSHRDFAYVEDSGMIVDLSASGYGPSVEQDAHISGWENRGLAGVLTVFEVVDDAGQHVLYWTVTRGVPWVALLTRQLGAAEDDETKLRKLGTKK